MALHDDPGYLRTVDLHHPRLRPTLELVQQQMDVKDIAYKLGKSPRTVQSQVQQLVRLYREYLALQRKEKQLRLF